MPPLNIVIVGAGNRGLVYGSYARHHPDEMRVVGVADPDARRRARAAERFGVPAERQYDTAEALAAAPRFADAAINTTMDREHLPTTLPLLETGYDVLLEKPFAVSADELWRFVDAVQRTQRKLMICHVLRYAPFYRQIRERVAAGDIGHIAHVRTAEYVGYDHMAAAFVRGKWNRRAVNPILLAKCCHDLDLICWMKSGAWPRRVASFAGRSIFTPEQAPEGAGTRCLVDCRIERDCSYSAKRIYVERKRWSQYAWHCIEHIDNPTDEDKLHSLRTDNPHGRCVWHCDNDVADHQGVTIQFDDATTAQHSLVGGAARAVRQMHLIGTRGEIQGNLEDGAFTVHRVGDEPEHIKLDVTGDMHGGGDLRLVGDFLRVVRGEQASISTTHLNDSLASHLIAFAADEAMRQHKVVELADAPAEHAAT